MGRPYTAREYFDFIEGAAAAVSGIGLGADVMVGFPGETDEDLKTTCENIKPKSVELFTCISIQRTATGGLLAAAGKSARAYYAGTK